MENVLLLIYVVILIAPIGAFIWVRKRTPQQAMPTWRVAAWRAEEFQFWGAVANLGLLALGILLIYLGLYDLGAYAVVASIVHYLLFRIGVKKAQQDEIAAENQQDLVGQMNDLVGQMNELIGQIKRQGEGFPTTLKIEGTISRTEGAIKDRL